MSSRKPIGTVSQWRMRDTVTGEVIIAELTIDEDWLCSQLVRRAKRSTRGRTERLNGAVKLRIVSRSTPSELET